MNSIEYTLRCKHINVQYLKNGNLFAISNDSDSYIEMCLEDAEEMVIALQVLIGLKKDET